MSPAAIRPVDQPRVSVVIPAYQGGQELLEAVDSAWASYRRPEEVIVVDNGSEDGSIEALRDRFPDVRLLCNGSNLGFGAACNRGIELARRLGHRFTLLLNQDARLDPDTLGSLLELAYRQPRAAAIGCLTLSSDSRSEGHSRILYNGSWRRWLPTWQRLPGLGGSAATAERQPRKADYVWGHAMLLRQEALAEQAPFDPGFFMYYEDLDLCWRLQQAGWEIWCDSRVVVWHRQRDSARAQGSCLRRWRMKAASSRYFYRKRHRPMRADALWLLHNLREVAPLLLAGHWLAVGHIGRATLGELKRPAGSEPI